MKTMKKMMTLLAVVGLVLALAPAAQAATITYLGSDETTHDAWRSTSGATKPAAFDPNGDNAYGTDGYYVNHGSGGTLVLASVLPSYVTSVTTLASTYNSGGYAQIDDPTLAIAGTVSPDVFAGVFFGKEDIMSFVLEEDSHFVLTIILGGNYNQNRPTGASLTQFIGGTTTEAATSFPVPTIDNTPDYVFFEVDGSANDAFKIVLTPDEGISAAIHGVAFEALPPAGTVIMFK
jgi:hypothetical protein